MKMEPIVSSETSAIRTQTPGNYPKRNKLHLEHGESLKTIQDKCLTVRFIMRVDVLSVLREVRRPKSVTLTISDAIYFFTFVPCILVLRKFYLFTN